MVVAEVREFNRFYTRVIGVLTDALLDTPYTLAEARVLFELAQRESTEAVDLRRTLGLDAGYLSRILARLSDDGLIVRQRSTSDGRRQVIRLTGRGRASFAELDARSEAEIGKIIGRLTEGDQRRLLGAMRSIHGILGDAPRPPAFVLRPPAPGDFGWLLQRHGALYAQEYGWDVEFERLVAGIVAEYLDHPDPRREATWIADVDGEPVGSVMCVRESDEIARLRVLLVEPRVRGMGVGSRLVDECLRFARRAGYRRIVLWTYDALGDARRLYQRAGFELVREKPEHSYGKDLVGQEWARDLVGT
jgi:DNA-binding MarR family transcriptional regulator/GNAT superfamily N-acetyltransferase